MSHGLIGPVLGVAVDLLVALGAYRCVDAMALAEGVPVLLDLVWRHGNHRSTSGKDHSPTAGGHGTQVRDVALDRPRRVLPFFKDLLGPWGRARCRAAACVAGGGAASRSSAPAPRPERSGCFSSSPRDTGWYRRNSVPRIRRRAR